MGKKRGCEKQIKGKQRAFLTTKREKFQTMFFVSLALTVSQIFLPLHRDTVPDTQEMTRKTQTLVVDRCPTSAQMLQFLIFKAICNAGRQALPLSTTISGC